MSKQDKSRGAGLRFNMPAKRKPGPRTHAPHPEKDTITRCGIPSNRARIIRGEVPTCAICRSALAHAP